MACIRKRSDRWQCQVRRKGFEPRSKTFAQRKDAERWGVLQERDLDELESRGERARVVPCDLDLATALKLHAASVKAKSGDHYLLIAMSRRSIAKGRLEGLNRTHYIRYRDDRLTEVGPRTVARELWLFQRTYDLARKEWGFPSLENAARDVSKPRQPRGRERRLESGEERRLLDAAATIKTANLQAIIRFAIETAMRQGEILALDWRHIDLVNRTVLLPKTKNGRARTVPLSRRATDILTGLPARSGKVFATTQDALKQAWNRLVAKAGCIDLRFHDLRHEAVSRLFEKGLEMPEAMMVSGHTDPRMLVRYTHLSARKLIEKLDASDTLLNNDKTVLK